MSKVKCLVWDLDDTLWAGTLVEGDAISLHEEAIKTIRYLDERGVLHSIASRNDHHHAIAKLKSFGILDYFLCPQVYWGRKSESIRVIAEQLNLGIDSIVFIDNDPFERMEVSTSFPEVRCLSFENMDQLMAALNADLYSVSNEARNRRRLYQEEFQRKDAEREFDGPKESFLQSLNMELNLSSASSGDLQRLEELTNRTHQMNSTGLTYSARQLMPFIESKNHLILVGSLKDKFGDYGKIAMALIECEPDAWRLRLLINSCRVISRGVGTILLDFLALKSSAYNVKFFADFKHSQYNRIMYITYKFAGFKEQNSKEQNSDETVTLLQYMNNKPRKLPDYIKIIDNTGLLDDDSVVSNQKRHWFLNELPV